METFGTLTFVWRNGANVSNASRYSTHAVHDAWFKHGDIPIVHPARNTFTTTATAITAVRSEAKINACSYIQLKLPELQSNRA